MTAKLTVTTTVHRNYESTENVKVRGKEEKEVELDKEIETVEECLEILNGTQNEVVRKCWDEVRDTEEFEEFGYYGPYAKGKCVLYPSFYETQGPTLHNIVDEIAEREDVEDKAGIYLDLMKNNMVRERMSTFYEYLAKERGVDTSYYVHGESV